MIPSHASRRTGHAGSVRALLAFLLALLPGLPLAGQVALPHRPVLEVELFRPHIRDAEGMSAGTFSSGAVVSYAHPIGARSAVAIEVPMAWGTFRYTGVPGISPESGQVLGNPEVTLMRTLTGSGSVAFSVGGRLPLLRDFGDEFVGQSIGILSDPTRMDRWGKKLGTVSAGLLASHTLAPGVRATARLTPQYWYSTGDDGQDGEFLAHYGASLSRTGEQVFGGLSLGGLAFLGDDGGDLSDRTINRAEGELGTTLGRMRVSGFVGVTLKDLFAHSSRYSMGIRARTPLR